MLRFLALLFFAAMSGESFAANDWVNLLAQDPTGGLVTGHVCYTTNGHDLSCDVGAPTITSGTLYVATSVSSTNGYFGTVSATTYFGDGSHLSGVTAASADRITSGTTSMLAISNTGYVSLTQSGVNTGWFDPARGLVTIGVSSTGPISGTTGSFSGLLSADHINITRNWNTGTINWNNGALTIGGDAVVGFIVATNFVNRMEVGSNGGLFVGNFGGVIPTVSQTLHVSGTLLTTSWTYLNANPSVRVTPSAPLEVSGTISATHFVGDGSGLTGIAGASADRIVSGTTSMLAISNTGYVSLTQSGVNTGWFDPASGLVTIGVSSTGPISATNGYFSGNAAVSNSLAVGGNAAVNSIRLLFDSGHGGATAAKLSSSGSDGTLDLLNGGTTYVHLDGGGASWMAQGGLALGKFAGPTSSALEVLGTISASNVYVTATTGTVSATNGYFGSTSSTTGTFGSLTVNGVAITGNASGDRIVSSTTSMVANSATSIISITNAGVTAGYFNSNGVLTVPGISATANLTSVTSLYASGKVGIGTSAPSTSLNVYSGGMRVSGPNSGYINSPIGMDRAELSISNSTPRLLLEDDNFNGTWQIDNSVGLLRFIDINSGTVTVPIVISTSGNVGIGNGTPKATLDVVGTISVSTAIQVGSNSLTCASNISGTMRYSAISSTMEYCNSTAWISMGPSATQPVSFQVNKGGTAQTVTASTETLLTWSTKVFDTNNNFASNRFTPTVPGKYMFVLDMYCSNSTGYCSARIKRNGTVIGLQESPNDGGAIRSVTAITDMNGTTDYVEAYGYAGGTTIDGTTSFTNFSGVMLAPQGNSGGGATPAGSTNDVQINSSGALAADTGNFTYASSVLKAPTVSATTITGTNINGTYISGTNVYGKNVSATTLVVGALSVTTNQTSVTTLYASGKLGVNEPSPGTQFVIKAVNNTGTMSNFEDTSGFAKIQIGLTSDAGFTTLRDAAGTAQIDLEATGTSYLNGGNVGIGTATPATVLDVRAPGTYSMEGNGLYVSNGNTSPYSFIQLGYDSAISAGFIRAGQSSTGLKNLVLEPQGGNVGIGTVSPGQLLTVAGNLNAAGGLEIDDTSGSYIPESGAGAAAFINFAGPSFDYGLILKSRNAGTTPGIAFYNTTSMAGSITYTATATTYNTSSDRRLKEHIAPTTRGLEQLSRIKVRDFNFIADPRKTRVQGFIAQDLYKVYPEAVAVGGADAKKKPWAVDYGRLTPLLVESIQELKADNDNLRAEFEAYKRTHP